MALTATATVETRKVVCRLLGIINPVVILEVPDHPNIKYIVHALDESMEDTFAPLVDEIRQMRLNMDKVIIYCRTYDDCSSIYTCIYTWFS